MKRVVLSFKKTRTFFGDKLKYGLGWLGPRRVLLVFFALISIQTGIGTLQGFSGNPKDAPHLLIPQDVRGVLWILFALIAVFLLTKRKIKTDKLAITFLAFMPILRLVSYLMSWILSFDALMDTLFNDVAGFQGARNAFYLSLPYQAEVLILIVAGWSPSKWKMVSRFLSEEIEKENSKVERPQDVDLSKE